LWFFGSVISPLAVMETMSTDIRKKPSAEEVARQIADQLATREVRQILREAAEGAKALSDELREKRRLDPECLHQRVTL
jgi:hypothetical protein